MNRTTSNCPAKRMDTPILAVCMAAALLALPASGHAAKSPYATPTITCGAEKTQTSLTVQICAGSTGAPSGFSLQWMTKAEFEENGYVWADSSDDQLCKASFSGNANLSRYNLKAWECVTVNVGEFLFDNGCSVHGMTDPLTGLSACDDGLACGTDYVFRAFAHGDSKYNRSSFTAELVCSTQSCYQETGCTYTQGFWKTHGPDTDGAELSGAGDCQTGNNSNEWPVSSLHLGSASGYDYNEGQLCTIFNTPAQGNGLIALAHQLIAAKLNVANGASLPHEVEVAIQEADALINSTVVGGAWACSKGTCSGAYLPSSATSALTTILMNYNEGAIGPGHCE